jgi:phosphoribosylformylglycinamidine (FGAM) synthase-like enzyme
MWFSNGVSEHGSRKHSQSSLQPFNHSCLFQEKNVVSEISGKASLEEVDEAVQAGLC